MDLREFFKDNKKIAIAFSGGTDSAYLLYLAGRYAQDTTAYYVKSAFQPEFELMDAKELATSLRVKLRIIDVDVLGCDSIVENSIERCYFCKNTIFRSIISEAALDGYRLIADGTNASDSYSDRPGMRALSELRVVSPFREAGLTKEDIRKNSKDAGLFTWDKPAYACLATRIPHGEKITAGKLFVTEKAESYLSSIGFVDFRVRMIGDTAKIQVRSNQLSKVIEKKSLILNELKKYYASITLDLEDRG